MRSINDYSALSYLTIAQTLFEELYSSRNSDEKCKLVVSFPNETEFNAEAKNSAVCDYVKMNIGTLLKIISYSKSAFINPICFPDLGNPMAQVPTIVTGGYDPVQKQLLFSEDVYDKTRAGLSLSASIIMLRFVFSHELGHLFNGHTRLLQTLYYKPAIRMIEKKKSSYCSYKQACDYALDRRTLEMDADAFAASTSFDNVLVSYFEKQDTEYWFQFLKNPIQIFRLWSFSVQSVFLLLENTSSTTYRKDEFYLPNEARAAMVFSSSMALLEHYKNFSVHAFSDNVFDEIIYQVFLGISEANKYFNLMHNTEYEFIVKTANDPIYREYKDEVEQHWNSSLRQQLEPFARVRLFNPKTIEQTMDIIKNGGTV